MQKDYTKIDDMFARFYELYLEGRKNKAPESYIDYFKARNFLLNEISLSEQSLLERVEKEIQDYFTRMININDGKLPYVIFGGKADENEKITLYKSGLDDALKILTSLKHLPQEEIKNK
jgi:hypothetical protein